MRIFLLGMMGCGKSHWGKVLSKHFSLPFFDLDYEVEFDQNKTIGQIFESEGEAYFRDLETKILKRFAQKDNFILALGGGTPCFNDNMSWVSDMGESIWINESPETIRERLLPERAHRPLLKSLNDESLLQFLKDKIEERTPFYSKAKFIVSGSPITTEDFMFIENILDKKRK